MGKTLTQQFRGTFLVALLISPHLFSPHWGYASQSNSLAMLHVDALAPRSFCVKPTPDSLRDVKWLVSIHTASDEIRMAPKHPIRQKLLRLCAGLFFGVVAMHAETPSWLPNEVLQEPAALVWVGVATLAMAVYLAKVFWDDYQRAHYFSPRRDSVDADRMQIPALAVQAQDLLHQNVPLQEIVRRVAMRFLDSRSPLPKELLRTWSSQLGKLLQRWRSGDEERFAVLMAAHESVYRFPRDQDTITADHDRLDALLSFTPKARLLGIISLIHKTIALYTRTEYAESRGTHIPGEILIDLSHRLASALTSLTEDEWNEPIRLHSRTSWLTYRQLAAWTFLAATAPSFFDSTNHGELPRSSQPIEKTTLVNYLDRFSQPFLASERLREFIEQAWSWVPRLPYSDPLDRYPFAAADQLGSPWFGDPVDQLLALAQPHHPIWTRSRRHIAQGWQGWRPWFKKARLFYANRTPREVRDGLHNPTARAA